MDPRKMPLDGLLVIRPKVFRDARGWFQESYNERAILDALGHTPRFVQENESMSQAGVVRGLHFQAAPHAQAKLVRVISGSALDVLVDIRPESSTYGQHYKLVLDSTEKCMLYIPEGFAHGFRALENGTIFSYKCTAFYEPAAERCILWNDPALGIDWGVTNPMLSGKDMAGKPFAALAAMI